VLWSQILLGCIFVMMPMRPQVNHGIKSIEGKKSPFCVLDPCKLGGAVPSLCQSPANLVALC